MPTSVFPSVRESEKLSSQPKAAIEDPTDTLTEREREVLRLIGEGLNNSAIAERLHLAPGTVRNYVSTIFEKLNVADRTQAAIIAMKAGFVQELKIQGSSANS